MPIMLRDIWPIENLRDYKIHFARYNRRNQPLDDFARDPEIWREWQEYRPQKDVFNRKFIFSLAKFYHENDIWLFGGVYEVLTRHPNHYEVELTQQGAGFIGRLKLRLHFEAKTSYVNLETKYNDFEVQEILRERYTGRAFPGFDNIHLSFCELEALVRAEKRLDWRSPLQSVAGIYLITVHTANTVRQYVGAAYGGLGVWSRWAEYIRTGHGNNAGLTELVDEHGGIDYCRQHFRFTLLEHMPLNTLPDNVLAREVHWKRILGTRGRGGLNRN